MEKLIQWLAARPLVNVGMALVYYLLVVLPHEWVGVQVGAWLSGLTRSQANTRILIAVFVSLALYFIPVFRGLFRAPQKWGTLFYLVATIALTVLAFNTLVILNTELIHFFQYAMMAVLMFPLCKTYGSTLFWVCLLGAIDEGYQYFYLAPERTGYYDFNDVIINTLGGVFGLILLKSQGIAFMLNKAKQWWKNPIFWTILGGILIFIALKVGGLLYVYPPDGDTVTPILLYAKPRPPVFWSVVYPRVYYHVVQPLEGLILTSILLLFYKGLDLVDKTSNTPAVKTRI